ncbi:glycosyltransferase family 2 protein [Streptomyces lacrimifluminis]|uniref:Glycosyl transferase n=1 Tax=Streptomyces lacrimifluminis TaxID=1500077 RepID=A0A917KIH5_9ACTN|nr:glycosyltransferase family 2 protein [Streptomyces lacrimifluminis]GGJ12933.1 glycosyl transferase [Streptomyces lacrimifluminis]
MPVKVSVIVPVYNPGPYIEDCVASLLRQSLSADEYEVIFVDDGSTDETPALLDKLAAEEPRVQVIHQENSGWSGKPRNVGIEASQGEFVMFVDNDDYLGDEALERMYEYGVANGADVIVGKMAGKGRPVPVELFRHNHPKASVENAPLIDSLTPHKMLRRAFLDRIGLRFPEGRRRLEDHVFVTEAYLRADNVSVLSDYVCYYHVKRDDASNAGFQRFDPVGYFRNLREALDVVERYTEPGAVRDRLFRRWLRNEMVERMRGNRLLKLPEDYRKEMFDEIRGVVVERFGPGVANGMQEAQRIVAALIAADRLDDVVAFAEWEASLAPTATPRSVEWRDGVLHVGFTAEFTSRGTPMTFPAEDDSDGADLDGTPTDADDAIARVGASTVARFGSATADFLVRERATAAQFFQPVELTRETLPADEDGQVRLVLRGTATVAPGTAAGGVALGGGLFDVFVRIKLGGWTRECRLGPVKLDPRPVPPAGVVAGRVVLPYWTAKQATLSLDVDRAVKGVGFARLKPDDVTVTGDRLRVALPLHVPGDAKAALRLVSPASAEPVEVSGTLSGAPEGSGAVVEATLPGGELADGTWKPSLCLAPEAGERRFLAMSVGLSAKAGRVQVVRPAKPAGPSTGQRVVRKVRRTLGKIARKAGLRRGNGA